MEEPLADERNVRAPLAVEGLGRIDSILTLPGGSIAVTGTLSLEDEANAPVLEAVGVSGIFAGARETLASSPNDFDPFTVDLLSAECIQTCSFHQRTSDD